MNNRGSQQHPHASSGPPQHAQRSPHNPSKGGAGESGGQNTAKRIEQRLRDPARIIYFDKPTEPNAKPAPRKELFDKEAETLAKKLAGIPASQLRRFYTGVRAIKRQLDLDPNLGIDFIKAELALLKARSAYALARLDYRADDQKDPDQLLTLLVRHGNSFEDRKSFNAFVRHFEAIMAYHKVFEEKRANR